MPSSVPSAKVAEARGFCQGPSSFELTLAFFGNKFIALFLSILSEVESSKACQAVLRARMADGSMPPCTIVDDVVNYESQGAAKEALALTAGFPCQAYP